MFYTLSLCVSLPVCPRAPYLLLDCPGEDEVTRRDGRVVDP